MRDYKFTEEFARWAFEIKCQETNDWYIAFTNPTAGPWKAITAIDKNGEEGVVYTFDSHEKRPDIILVNDKLKIVIIVEAKSNIKDLTADDQCEKSTKVVAEIGKQLQKARTNTFWGKRYMYHVFLGLLWGNENTISSSQYNTLFDSYHNEILKYENIDKRAIIGIEVVKDELALTCKLDGRNYEKGKISFDLDEIAKTFNL